jgi:hypothetical protein
MKHMVRTKIKGNSTVDSSDDVRAPNFDNLPPLPICNKQPSAVLHEMESAILKLHSSFGAIAHRDLTMASLPCPEPTNFNGAVLPRTETPCDFSVNYYNQDQSLLMPDPPLFSRRVSSDSQSQWHRPCVLQADTTDTESTRYTNQLSVQGTYHPFQSHAMLRADDNDLCFSPLMHNNFAFEPLPFRDDDDELCGDNELCDDDFANFIQGAIQQVEG